MEGVGRDLCGSSSPTPLLKQGHLEQAAEDLVQAGLEYLQKRGIYSLPGQPVPVLHHPQGEEVLPHVQTELCVRCALSCHCVTKNPGIKPRNTNVVLKGRHSLLRHRMHGG